MRKHHTPTGMIPLSLLVLCLYAASTRAAEDAPVGANALLAKQHTVQDRLDRLEDRLFRVRETLTHTQPESADRLELAIKRFGELRVKSNIADVLRKIEAGQLDEASDEQQKVLEDLRNVLKLLTEQRNDPEEQRKELRRLEAVREQLRKIIDEQETEQVASQRARQGLTHGKDLAMAAEKLEKLLHRQEELRKRTEISAGKNETESAKTLERDQNKLGTDSKALSFFLEELADWLGEGTAETEKGNHEAGAPPKAEKNGAASSAKKHLDDAGQEMEAAEKALDRQNVRDALGPQQAAIENMRLALQQLKDAHEKMDTAPDFRKMSADQRGTQKLTERLARRMKDSSQKGRKPSSDNPGQAAQNSKGPQGSKGGQTPDAKDASGRKPTPGQQQVADAEKHMGDAAQNLDKQDPTESETDQAEAMEKLESAMADLDDTIKQLREERKSEMLRDLQERFQAMLKKQTSIKLQTASIHKMGTENWTRAEELKLATLSKEQHGLGDDAMKALKLLGEDGTTTVFPHVVEDMADQMYTVSDRVVASKVGLVTQRMQEEILETIEELLDALEQAAGKGGDKSGGGGGGGGGSGGGPAPLVPGSAELKLLRSMQVRVNRQTKTLPQAGNLDPDVLKKLAERQLNVSDMAKEMHKRILERGR